MLSIARFLFGAIILFISSPGYSGNSAKIPVDIVGKGLVGSPGRPYCSGPVTNCDMGNFEMSFFGTEHVFFAMQTEPTFVFDGWEITEPGGKVNKFGATTSSVTVDFNKFGWKVKAKFREVPMPVTVLACDSTKTVSAASSCTVTGARCASPPPLPLAITLLGTIKASHPDFDFEKWEWVTAAGSNERTATLKVKCLAKQYPVNVFISGRGQVSFGNTTCNGPTLTAPCTLNAPAGAQLQFTSRGTSSDHVFKGWSVWNAAGILTSYTESTATLPFTQTSGGSQINAMFGIPLVVNESKLVKSFPGGELPSLYGADGLTTDIAQNVYVAAHNSLVKFSPSGVLLMQVEPTQSEARFGSFSSVAVDSTGRIFVASPYNYAEFGSDGYLHIFDDAGVPLGRWDSDGMGPGTDRFSWKRGFVKIDGNDNVYVAGSTEIRRFSKTGQLIAKWGTPGTGPVQFGEIAGLAIDAAGSIYVSDNKRIQVLNSNGGFVKEITIQASGASVLGPFQVPDSTVPGSLALDTGGNLYTVTATGQLCAINLATGAQTKRVYATVGNAEPYNDYKKAFGQLHADRKGMFYSRNSHGVSRYTPASGKIAIQFKQSSTAFTPPNVDAALPPLQVLVAEDGGVTILSERSVSQYDADGKRTLHFWLDYMARAIATDSQDNILVVKYANQLTSVVKYNPSGQQIASYDMPVAEGLAYKLFIDKNDNFYVVFGPRLRKYDAAGKFIKAMPIGGSSGDVGIGADDLIYAHYQGSDVYFYDLDGNLVRTIPDRNHGGYFFDGLTVGLDGFFYAFHGLANFSESLMYFTKTNTNGEMLQRPSFEFQPGAGLGRKAFYISSKVVDADGRFYMVDSGNGRVTVLAP